MIFLYELATCDRLATLILSEASLAIDKIQTHAGIFHLLPLGLRVERKLQGLIAKHMSALGKEFHVAAHILPADNS